MPLVFSYVVQAFCLATLTPDRQLHPDPTIQMPQAFQQHWHCWQKSRFWLSPAVSAQCWP
jgi:hypothetical protein